MVICIGCAIIGTLIQQWGRRYLSLTQGRDPAPERERVRDFLYNGIKRFHMHWVRQTVGMPGYCTLPSSSTAWVLSSLLST
jgi:hypothetical protein